MIMATMKMLFEADSLKEAIAISSGQANAESLT
jgi:hypothetical protein